MLEGKEVKRGGMEKEKWCRMGRIGKERRRKCGGMG